MIRFACWLATPFLWLLVLIEWAVLHIRISKMGFSNWRSKDEIKRLRKRKPNGDRKKIM